MTFHQDWNKYISFLQMIVRILGHVGVDFRLKNFFHWTLYKITSFLNKSMHLELQGITVSTVTSTTVFLKRNVI